MPDLANNQSPNDDSISAARPERKVAKPSFAEFHEVLLSIVGKQGKGDAAGPLLKLIKGGFAENIQPDHVESVLQTILDCEAHGRLAVRLTTETPQRGNHLSVALRNRLRKEYGERLGYPSESTVGDRLFDVTQWIRQGDAKRESDADRFSDGWVRMAFVCLTSEPDKLTRSIAVQQLLRSLARRLGRGDGGAFQTDERSFLREVGKLFSGRQISAKRICSALQFGYPAEEQRQHDRIAAAEAQKCAEDAIDRATVSDTEARRLQSIVETLTSSASEFRKRVDVLESQLKLEMERKVELEALGRREAEQQLARQRHSLKTRLQHELQEARLSLDGDEPNIAMALSRIRQMEETLSNLD